MHKNIDLSHRYSDAIHNTKVALLGPCPPPLGGISVHIIRVSQKLQRQNNTVFHIETTTESRYRLFLWYLFNLCARLLWIRPKVVIYQTIYLSNSAIELLCLTFFKKILRYKLLLVEHDCRHLYKRSTLFKKILNTVLNSTNELILIGDITHKSYKENTINLTKNTSIEGAFLPPDSSDEEKIIQEYPESLVTFFNNHKPFIIVNAFQLVLLNGNDLYGIDACIALMTHLKKTYPLCGLCIMLGRIGNQEYFDYLKSIMKQSNLEAHIYILHAQKELWPALKRCDLFVRPTLSDGASVSIQEALYFNKPVVASDVCARPQGTELFITSNTQDFIKKVDKVLRRIYANHNQQCHYLHPQ
jgi:glycosyltransferase involved in cell wall biosynthesis